MDQAAYSLASVFSRSHQLIVQLKIPPVGDVGVTSVIRGHGARIGLFYGSQDTAGAGDVSVVKLGLQLKL